jgi:transcriptional regulator GlxA family with amidase domain
MAASSTGTVVVAAAGLLGEREAATHWLASSLLESYGSAASNERIVEVGNIITCEGRITAMHVALLVTLRMAGPEALAQVRAELARPKAPPPKGRTPRQRWRQERDRRRSGPGKPRNPELVAPDVIEFDPLTRLC